MNSQRLTLIIDTREQTPLLFPSTFTWRRGRGFPDTRIIIKTVRQKMDAGDYYIQEHPSICILERKTGPLELIKNLCTKDFARQARAFKKLRDSCRYPLLLVESDPVSFHEYAIREGFDYLLDYFLEQTAKWKIEVMWGGAHRTPARRRILGEIALRWMLQKISRGPA